MQPVNNLELIPTPLPKWVVAMKSEAWAKPELEIGEMTVEERFALARLHAYEFANCRKSERRNRSIARKIAAGIARLALDHRFADMTAREYMTAAKAVWALGGKSPMYSAHQVVAGVTWQ